MSTRFFGGGRKLGVSAPIELAAASVERRGARVN